MARQFAAHRSHSRLRLSRWMIAIAGLIVLAAAGQAIGPVVTGGLFGSAGLTIEQGVFLSSAPSVSGSPDALGTVNDEGIGFTVGLETHVGREQVVTLNLANRSDALANATLMLDIPRGLDVELDSNLNTSEAQLSASSWVLKIPVSNSTDSFKLSTVDSTGDRGEFSSLAALDSSNIFISYFDDTNNDLKFIKSSDGGKAFSSPSTLNSSDSVLFWNSLAAVTDDTPADGPTIFVAYRGDGTLKFVKSTDGGDSFTSPATIDDSGNTTGQEVALTATSQDNIFVAYHDETDGDLRFVRSTDGGSSFSSSVKLDSVGTTGTPAGRFNSIAAVGQSVFVSYHHDIGGGDGSLKFVRSTDNGASFTTPATLDFASGGGGVGAFTATAAPDTKTVFIGYYDDLNGNLKFARSTDGGSNFTLSTIDSTATDPQRTSIAAPDQNKVFVATYDGNSGDLNLLESTDGGSTFGGSPTVIDSTGTTGNYPSIAAPDSANLFISYYDDDPDDLNLARSGNGIRITVESKDNIRNGFYTLTGRLAQVQ